jgi:hypothetical protein
MVQPVQHPVDDLHLDGEAIRNELHVASRLRDPKVPVHRAEVDVRPVEGQAAGSSQALCQRGHALAAQVDRFQHAAVVSIPAIGPE